MASLNRVYLMGNLTKDPEVKYLPDGTAVADMRLAVSERYRSRSSGEQVERTVFVDINVWRAQAESCGKYLSKGSPILVEGRLHLDEWEAQDGSKRSRLRVRAQRVQFLSSPRHAEHSDTSGSSAPPGVAPTGGGGNAGGGNAGGGGNTSGGAPSVSAESLGDDDNLPF